MLEMYFGYNCNYDLDLSGQQYHMELNLKTNAWHDEPFGKIVTSREAYVSIGYVFGLEDDADPVLKYLEKAPECNIATSTIDKLRMVLNVIRGDKDVNTFMGFDVDKQMSVPLAELTFEGVLAGVDCDKAVFILAPL